MWALMFEVCGDRAQILRTSACLYRAVGRSFYNGLVRLLCRWLRGEKLTTFLRTGHREFVEEVFVDAPEHVTRGGF